jgi:signal transduction histidine kinase
MWTAPTSLSNLIRNGIDATRAIGSAAGVRLRVSARGTRALCEVLDAGPGIAPGISERLGEPFFTTKPVGTGMGLGVYLVKTFAHQVGGSIDFETAPGGGTIARLTLGEGSIEVGQPA